MPIYVESDALRSFAAQLKKFSETIGESKGRTQGQLGRLGESWKDEGFTEFQEVFTRTYATLDRFVAEAENVVPKLILDADAIDEYTRFRPE